MSNPRQYLLLLHGNGGAHTRFTLLLPYLEELQPQLEIVMPQLPGFSGRPLSANEHHWKAFLQPIAAAIAQDPTANWTLYGHGIGGSVLLEWAAQGYRLPTGENFQPRQVILHAPVGASLRERWFPALMKPKPMRNFIHWLIYQPWLQPVWEKRLFLFPEKIPPALKRQFFQDYRQCAAFPVFFDLITPAWYTRVQPLTSGAPFQFLWGEKERVIASKHLQLWQNDYPQANFRIVPEWDHFPMLEQTADFARVLVDYLHNYPDN